MPKKLSQSQKYDSGVESKFDFCYRFEMWWISVGFVFQEAPQLNIDNNLIEYVGAKKDKKIPYAIVRGTVSPIGVPLQSIRSPNVTGVLQVITVK